MAQALAETIFDILYLCFALLAGLTMSEKGSTSLVIWRKRYQIKNQNYLTGIM